MAEDQASLTEQARLNALENYNIMDTAAEMAFDRLTQLASTFYECPIALVSLVDDKRQWFKSRVGLDASETPRNISFCQYAIKGETPFIVPNALEDERFRENPLVTGAPDIRFYAGAPLKHPDGHKIGTLCIIDKKPREDFTDQSAAQLEMLAEVVISEMELRIKNDRLEQAMREVESASKARSDFIATISHEIRTPLSGIIGLAETLDDFDLDDNGRKVVEGIQASSRILMGLLNDVLDYAKIEAGKIQVHLTDVRFQGFIDTFTRTWCKIADEKGLKLSITQIGEMPGRVSMDELRTSQIINNILSNAIKFTDTGAVTVTIEPAVIDPLNSRAMKLTILDTGKGMSEDQLQRLFQPFEQADASVSQNYGGTGLGMAITSNLVSLLGGTIACESEVGKGTRFDVVLPLGLSGEELGRPAQETEPAMLALRVLVVDDMDINLQIAKHFLQKLGHIPELADHPHKALSLIAHNEYDLVLTDLHMPDMNGLELAANIKSVKPFQKIISLSADDHQADTEEFSAHLDDFLLKPLSKEGLQAAIDKHFRDDG